MKNKLKKVFENAVWWSGVVMVGLVLGLTIQFVKAWTEPTAAPPDGNVGAPINTSAVSQMKLGALQVLGLTTEGLRLKPPGVDPVAGQVLSASNDFGDVAWAAAGATGGSACFTYYCNNARNNICTDSGGAQKYCPSGFQQKYDMGTWGSCVCDGGTALSTWFYSPPGGNCPCQEPNQRPQGKAFVCCQ